MKYLLILVMFITSTAFGQVEIKKTKATITKYEINYGDTTKQVIPAPSLIAISEADSSLLVGNRPYQIQGIVVDSVVTYIAKDTPYKEFVYNKDKSTLTQKNIKFRDSHQNETWFEYAFTVIKNENEFEF